MAKHLVKHWKGARESYNFLKEHGFLDPWTRYEVVDPNGTITSYFGENLIAPLTGQLLPVNDILSTMPETIEVNPYDRFLIGTDAEGYQVIEFTPDKDNNLVVEKMDFDYRYGVRVKSQMLKNFVYHDGKLVTYDDVNCGEY